MAYLPVVVTPPNWGRMRPGALKVREQAASKAAFVTRTRNGERVARCGVPLYPSYSGARGYAQRHLVPKPREEAA